MATRISVPLSEMDEQFLKELKAKYPGNTRLDIQVVDMNAVPSFTEEDFWGIIALLDWSIDGSRDEVLTPAVEALAQHPISHIYLFEDILAEKLFQLDTKAHAIAGSPEDQLSVDGFLYSRAVVVASGRDRYYQVLTSPDLMPTDEDFEPLLSLAALAFERKTGSPFDYFPPTDYETYSNKEGWQ